MALPAIEVAVLLLKADKPLPLDLQEELMADGVDVAALEDKYGA